MIRRYLCIGAFTSLGALSCGAADQVSSETPPETTFPRPSLERLAAINQDLLLGSSGDDVRALHGYLAAYGYFPNKGLASLYPAWRPIVAEAPARADVFDDKTSEAVRAFQGSMRLPATGIVDADTRAHLAMARCGVPDGIPSTDASNKYSINGHTISYESGFWPLGPTPPGITSQQATAAILANASRWNSTTNLNMHYANGIGTNYSVGTGTSQTYPYLAGHLAVANTATNSIIFNVGEYLFSAQTTTPAGFYDYESILLHEMGHMMGLNHSSWGGVMTSTFPAATQRRFLTTDDKVAASVKYDAWTTLQVTAADIGGSSIEGSVWIISHWDETIWKWMGGNNFTADSAQGVGKRIAVDFEGLPWVVAPWGVWRRTSNNPAIGTWEQLRTDCTTDIGIGNEDGQWVKAVWIVGCDGRLYKWLSGTSWQIDTTTYNDLTRVAVDSLGTPWVIASGRPWHKSNNDPNGGWWADLGGYATDIGVGTFPHAYRTTQTPGTFGYTVEAFNYQEAAYATPAEWRWIPIAPGGQAESGVNVAVANFGDPWTTQNNTWTNVRRTTK